MSPSASQPTSFRSNSPQLSIFTQSPSFDAPDSQHSRNGGPRPLHLTLASVVSTSPTPSSVSPHIVHSLNDTGPTYTAEDSGKQSHFIHSLKSPTGTPPLSPSATTLNLRKEARNKKRSSISYLPSNPQSPFLQTNIHDASDALKSPSRPLSSSHNRTAFFDGRHSGGLARSNSLGRGSAKTSRSATFGERSSTGSILHSDARFANGIEHLKERAPVTLAEKHSDLLHFIAQKESKCLELRSQLAVHEAELLQLKKKWERIVNRGFERGLNSNGASTPPSSYYLSSSPSHSTLALPDSASSSSNAPGAVVLEGIKEGVQGMTRFLTGGFGSMGNTPQTSEPNDKKTQSNGVSSPTAPLPLRLSSISTQRTMYTNGSGHVQKESQSSSSTAVSHATSLSFLSASSKTSATSASSVRSRSSISVETAKNNASGHETDSDFGDFEDGLGSASRTRSSTLSEQLMVHDTGATPTMSPNPHFERRKFRNMHNDGSTSTSTEVASVSGDRSGAPSTPLSPRSQRGYGEASLKEDFNWGDGWDEAIGEAQSADMFSSASDAQQREAKIVTGSFSGFHSPERAAHSPAEFGLKSPSASSRTLAPVDTNGSSSWVGSVGKKWGEIKGSSTFTKNQKRASLMLSDIQQSLVASLISPNSVTPSTTHSSPSTPATANTFSTNGVRSPIKAAPTLRGGMHLPQTRRGMSLIDDSDDESFGESGEDPNSTMRSTLPLRMSAPILVPDSARNTSTTKAVKVDNSLKQAMDDDDDWNW